LRVLIAEDSEVDRFLMHGVVKALGHEAAVAGNGDDAWEEYRRAGADVVISDWLMQGMQGDELCRRVRAEPGPYTYFVMVTGLEDPETIREGMQAGADDFLTKPLDEAALEALLVAAERVTALHGQLAAERAELERDNSRLMVNTGRDPLTGLPDRKRMAEDLDLVGAEVDRYGASCWLALCDIDNFRAFNASEGHTAGDDVLRAVAGAFQAGARKADRVYRHGGGRLMVLMTEQDREGAALGAERLRTLVERLEIDHRESPAGVVTVSIGVAGTMGAEPTDAPDLIRRAGMALGIAKQGGRNRVVVDGLADAPTLT
jgi:two-component system cell cycle response regulator